MRRAEDGRRRRRHPRANVARGSRDAVSGGAMARSGPELPC
jgi:hypothetical protein